MPNNRIDEALKMIKLIQAYLTQHLKWYSFPSKINSNQEGLGSRRKRKI
jgi:hypothetical protein